MRFSKLGILEDEVMDHVPGTTRYFDDPERPQYAADGTTGLKCDTSGPVPIILVPQPSDDPNDPLNWPLWKRDLITFILSMTAIFATALGPILAANTLTLTFGYLVPFTKIAELTGYYLLGVGVAAFLFVPSGRIWGKRHLFVAGTVILIATSAWGGASNRRGDYTSMVWARVFQGVATAPFESLVNAAVGDLYFVHQRGIRMAFTNLAVFGGAFFTPILVGKITHSIGWPWTFYFIAIFCGACLPAIYFFCPETAYRRDTALNLDLLDTNSDSNAIGQKESTAAYELHDNNAAIHELHGNNAHAHELDGNNPPIHELDGNNPSHGLDANTDAPSHGLDANTNSPSHGLDANTNSPSHGLNGNTDAPSHGLNGNNARTNAVNGEANQSGESSRVVEANEAAKPVMRPKATFRQSLALFNGRKTDESFWKLLLRPLPLFLQPAFLWACLIQGTMIGWTVFIGVILAQFFLATPLWWNEVQTGYAYTGAFIGAILGFVIAGVLSDWTARKMTKWNNGVYEPEFRIVLVIPQMILGCAGLYGWGITVDGLLHSRYHWAVPLTFFALEVAGMVIGAVASSLYIVDAYRGLAIEAFTCMIVFKNIFSFALTLKAFDWLVRSGSKATILFNALGSVQLVICLLSIPMYIFGKRIRSFFYRNDILAFFKVR